MRSTADERALERAGAPQGLPKCSRLRREFPEETARGCRACGRWQLLYQAPFNEFHGAVFKHLACVACGQGAWCRDFVEGGPEARGRGVPRGGAVARRHRRPPAESQRARRTTPSSTKAPATERSPGSSRLVGQPLLVLVARRRLGERDDDDDGAYDASTHWRTLSCDAPRSSPASRRESPTCFVRARAALTFSARSSASTASCFVRADR